MQFTAYIQRQKNLIRKRHPGDCVSSRGSEAASFDEREKLLCDLNSLKGLNTNERLKMNGAT